MKKWTTVLAGLFVFQLILVVVVYLSKDDYAAFQANEKLLSISFDTVNRLQIENEAHSVILEKESGQWVLPEKWNYPIDTPTLSQLLDTFSSLDKGWPVATTLGAAERFKVAENDFERKIIFLDGDKPQAKLFIGTSPGFRKTHVRLDGDDHIYAVAMESWKASAEADDWLKKDILSFDVTRVSKLTMADFVLTRTDRTLQPEDLAEQENPDESAISSLMDGLANLRIQSVNGNASKKMGSPDLVIDLMFEDGKAFNYQFYRPETTEDENGDYMLQRSDLPFDFTVAEFAVKPLLEATRNRLIRKSENEEDLQDDMSD